MESRRNFNGQNSLTRPSLLSLVSPVGEAINSHLRKTLIDQKAYNPLTEERKKDLYKNVLVFPQEIDYIKYFEKTPHVDQWPDKLLAIAEKFAARDLNTPSIQRRFDFNLVKRFLYPRLSEREKKLLHFPDKMQELLENSTTSDYRKAYTHLRDSFYNYFTTPVYGEAQPEIQWIDYDFINSYPPAQQALKELRANLFNSKGVEKLLEKLGEAGAFAKERKDFYFWNTDPHNWSDISYQARSVNFLNSPSFNPSGKFYLPAQYLALGDFTINALPEGYVQPKANGKYDICVNKVYFFINDSFNFEGNEPLGIWDLDYDPATSTTLSSLISVNNSELRGLQRHGYGRYFPVLSRLHEVQDFVPMCIER